MSTVTITIPVSVQCARCERRRAFNVPVDKKLAANREAVLEKARAEGWRIDSTGARCHRVACNPGP